VAVKTKTTYVCDGCGKEEGSANALRRFFLTEQTIAPKKRVAEAKTDLCAKCEKSLHEKALGLFPAAEAEKLHGIVRG
jgi:hypothetical protein